MLFIFWDSCKCLYHTYIKFILIYMIWFPFFCNCNRAVACFCPEYPALCTLLSMWCSFAVCAFTAWLIIFHFDWVSNDCFFFFVQMASESIQHKQQVRLPTDSEVLWVFSQACIEMAFLLNVFRFGTEELFVPLLHWKKPLSASVFTAV